jgi:protein associated with RNAse G/E
MTLSIPSNYIIKSFKHDGHLHRMWLENRRVPDRLLIPAHAGQSLQVFVNSQTPIREADGSEWHSRNPGVTFFVPGQWFNVVALIESAGIRYYCNIASPPYLYGNVLTYIDYDLDVILTAAGETYVVDEDEYERHKLNYHYSPVVDAKVKAGLGAVLELMGRRGAPFQDQAVMDYYHWWQTEVRM